MSTTCRPRQYAINPSIASSSSIATTTSATGINSSRRSNGGCRKSTWSTTRRWNRPPANDTASKSPTALVHVTHFNALMWDNGRTPVWVIEHGVPCRPDIRYTGEIPRGLVVVNNLGDRGCRVGPDIFEKARRCVPLDLVGMNSEPLGGLGEISPPQLAAFEARYRFLFNPIRYTSLGLAVCEAMMLGMPVVGLATTEMATAVVNGVTGFVDTSLERLVPRHADAPEQSPKSGGAGRQRPPPRSAAVRHGAVRQALARGAGGGYGAGRAARS